jgi:hypothetical protein
MFSQVLLWTDLWSKVEMSEVFFQAIRDGDLTTVQRMLREGAASTKQRDNSSWTALLVAIYCNRYLVAKWLLEHGGSSITERSDYGGGLTFFRLALFWTLSLQSFKSRCRGTDLSAAGHGAA